MGRFKEYEEINTTKEGIGRLFIYTIGQLSSSRIKICSSGKTERGSSVAVEEEKRTIMGKKYRGQFLCMSTRRSRIAET